MNKKKINKKRLPKYNPGTPWAFAEDPSKGLTMGNAQGIAGIAGGVGNIAQSIGASNEDVNAVDYAGNILSNAGSMAATGAMLGPWGAIGGAVLGTGMGLYQSITADNAQIAQEKQNAVNDKMSTMNTINGASRLKKSLRTDPNYRVPGLNNGTANFSSKYMQPNAMVANEEGVKNPITGQLDVIPGQYNQSNPDRVPVNLMNGTSIYSNSPKSIIPGGKSTPAKLIERMKRVQDYDNKITNSKVPSSVLDKRTAELNKKNIDKQTELLNMNTILSNFKSASTATGKLPRFDDGGVYSYLSGDPSNVYGRNYKFRLGAVDDKDPNFGSHIKIAYNDYKTRGGMAPFDVFSSAIAVEGNGNYNLIPGMMGRYGQPTNNTTNTPTTSTPTGGDSYIPLSVKLPVETTETGIYRNKPTITVTDITDEKKVNSPGIDIIDIPDDSGVEDYSPREKWNKIAPGPISRINTMDINIPEYMKRASNKPTTGEGVGGDGGGLNDNLFKKNPLSEIGTDLASLAPTMYNLFNSNPETWAPVYDKYVNPTLRANISKNIEDSRRQRQIARYNQRVMNSGSGAGMAYGSSIYSNGIENLNQIMTNADNINNQYRTASANITNQFGASNTNETRRIQDINAKNRAAARNMRATAMSQIGQYAQNKQLMSNQRQSDIMNSKIWEAYSAGTLSPEAMSEIESILGLGRKTKGGKA